MGLATRQPDRPPLPAANKQYAEESPTIAALKIARQKAELARLECVGAAMKLERRAKAHLEACDPKGADHLFRDAGTHFKQAGELSEAFRCFSLARDPS